METASKTENTEKRHKGELEFFFPLRPLFKLPSSLACDA